MQENLKEIRPGKGLGVLKFDVTKEEVLNLLGKPSEKESFNLSELENDKTEAWHYDDLYLSLSFDEENDWLLSSIAISSPDFLLDGEPLIGKSKEEILKICERKGWGEPMEDEEIQEENPENCLIHVDESGMSFWFENDELTEVQIGPSYHPESDN